MSYCVPLCVRGRKEMCGLAFTPVGLAWLIPWALFYSSNYSRGDCVGCFVLQKDCALSNQTGPLRVTFLWSSMDDIEVFLDEWNKSKAFFRYEVNSRNDFITPIKHSVKCHSYLSSKHHSEFATKIVMSNKVLKIVLYASSLV